MVRGAEKIGSGFASSVRPTACHLPRGEGFEEGY